EHHDLDVRIASLDFVEAGEPVHVRHADVEKHEVGLRPADERQDLRSRLRLTDDLEIAVLLERTANPVEDETMVVGDHDSHRILSVSQSRDDELASVMPLRSTRFGAARAPAPQRTHSDEGLPSPGRVKTLSCTTDSSDRRRARVESGGSFAA